MSRMAVQVTFVMVPSLLLIFLVLGTIFIGLATPTEGGAMGTLGSLILAAIKRRLDKNPNRFNWSLVPASDGNRLRKLSLPCSLHSDRRARFLAYVLRREWPRLG